MVSFVRGRGDHKRIFAIRESFLYTSPCLWFGPTGVEDLPHSRQRAWKDSIDIPIIIPESVFSDQTTLRLIYDKSGSISGHSTV